MSKIIGFDTETIFNGYTYNFYSFQAFSEELGLNLFSTSVDEISKVFNRDTRGAILLMKKMEYDLAVLRKILSPKQYKITITYNKAKPVKALIRRKDISSVYSWRIYDLENLFPNKTLAQIGQLIGCQKLPRPPYLGLRPPQNNGEFNHFRAYALRDAEICYRAGKYILAKFNKLRPTLPSISYADLLSNFVKKGLFAHWIADGGEWFKQFYKGGRVEAFWRGTTQEKIYLYDVNSLYPFVMYSFPYPKFISEPEEKSDVNLDYEGVAYCKVKVDAEIPPVGIRHYCDDKKVKFVFPTGIFSGFFTYPELRLLEESRVGKILKVNNAFEFRERFYPFRDFVEFYHSLKLTDTQNREFWKLYLNSVYGKFGQSGKLKHYQILKDGEMKEFKFENKKRNKKRSWVKQNYVISAYITAYARLYMWDLMRKVGFDNIIYTDTDSIFTTKRLTFTKKGLGQLELKSESENGEKASFIRSKFYIIGNTVKCKGLHIPITGEILRKLIAQQNTELLEKRLLRLREAFRTHHYFLTEVERRFTPSFKPDGKRLYLKNLNGKELVEEITTSRPLVLKNVKEVVRRA
ncbi:MAG: hypothetical protein KIH08_12815 [Candidatus Freyarchaeota archaeon]|nr:hypothetical protein [Candidatus Jordarchaeia archaeon]